MATGLDCKTYKGGAAAGGRITLARSASALSLSAQGTSVFWVKLNAKGVVLPALPVATPDPVAQATADGWLRVAAAEVSPSGGRADIPLPSGQDVTSLDVWCEAAGYLVVIATAGSPAFERRV